MRHPVLPIIALCTLAAAAARAESLRLKETADVARRFIRAADVLEGFAPDGAAAATLERVYLGAAPRRLERAYVERRLELAGVRLDARGLAGAAVCIVQSDGVAPAGGEPQGEDVRGARREVQGEESDPQHSALSTQHSATEPATLRSPTSAFEAVVARRARALVQAETGWDEADFECTLERISLAQEHQPRGAFTIQALRGALPADDGARLGRHVFHLDFAADRQDRRLVPVQVRVARRQTVVTAARDLSARVPLAAHDVTRARVLLSERDAGAFFDLEPLIGQELSAPVAAGQPLLRRALILRPLVRRGERVLVEQALVQSWATAEEDGLRGESIRVRAEHSKAVFVARVRARGRVTLAAPDAPASAARFDSAPGALP